MANKMLIDTTHPEETRVVVLRGNRVEEFDFESANRRQLRGNIYLAKVTRVEPSLQAAFIDYGGNRHGFLAFSEIHPDYYQIPVADRQALIAEEERAHHAAEAEADRRAGRPHEPSRRRSATARADTRSRKADASEMPPEDADADAPEAPDGLAAADAPHESQTGAYAWTESEAQAATDAPAAGLDPAPAEGVARDAVDEDIAPNGAPPVEGGEAAAASAGADDAAFTSGGDNGHAPTEVVEEEIVESVGGDALEEVQERLPRYRRQYKIQEVIKRRQIMLVQVVKEERGTKGAALTSYLSLAGRYSVLMPNTARGGGVSRKITNILDRKRLKDLAQELEVPEGMGVILRTAGASRTKTEIKRDFEYLLRLWETVRDLTLRSTAPKLVYEEGSLIKRSIRDLYGKEIDEVIVAGDEGHHEAKDFMRMLMPSHAKNVKPYADAQPLFSRYGIESQLDAMFSPVVQLRSGGYIVLNQTEALVSIDVNSGRATREHHIEDTALKTNLEASEEIARQLRLRDLAGLIVIDFIDMDEKRNNRSVERRLKECLKDDRARIQVGRISHFGLLEMSRQRIRASVLESSTETCPHCGGTGHVRSVSSVALQLLRVIEETLLRGATHNLVVRTRSEIALYVLNHKRAHLRDLESRCHVTLTISADATMGGQQPFVIEKGEQLHVAAPVRAAVVQPTSIEPRGDVEDDDDADGAADEAFAVVADENGARAAEAPGEQTETEERGENGQRRRRRRRRRGRRGGEGREERVEAGESAENVEDGERSRDEPAAAPQPGTEPDHSTPPAVAGEDDENARRRRRGRRGGRRNRRGHELEQSTEMADAHASPDAAAAETRHGGAADEFDDRAPVRASPTGNEPARAEPADAAMAQGRLFAPEAPPHAADADPPRRRSTVREPAPAAGDSARASAAPEPSSAPEIIVSGEAQVAQDAPRRSGWWARRFAGGGKD
ncbi:MAG: Rne/Rng family ribonuclease [Proteobacteria bacterium]|nr:Rne/Rng family ribonuclease [Pseudomonadota bacterium]